jgi:hypothetical protein
MVAVVRMVVLRIASDVLQRGSYSRKAQSVCCVNSLLYGRHRKGSRVAICFKSVVVGSR